MANRLMAAGMPTLFECPYVFATYSDRAREKTQWFAKKGVT